MTAEVDSSTEPYATWRVWTEQRETSIRARYGALALVSTVWLMEEEQPVDGLPAQWSAGPGGRTRLKAAVGDGILLDGVAVDGTVDLRPDIDTEPQVLTLGGRRIVPIAREGRAAVRIYDPDAEAHRNFLGIEYFSYDQGAVADGVYEPFDSSRTEQVLNADGAERGLVLSGAVRFGLGGQEFRLAVSAVPGGLSASFGDATNRPETFGFRFLALPEPGPDGRVLVDFNRAFLPPCAFTAHSLCPLPPEGNRLPAAIEAGERRARFRA